MNAKDKHDRPACGLCCTKIRHLSVTLRGAKILRDVNLHIHCGQLTAIIGPNGAGKTTLLQTILGELPYAGSIRFVDPKDERIGMPAVGYVPQRLTFDPEAPVSVQDLFSASLSATPIWLAHSPSSKRRARESLARVRSEHLIQRRLGDLSGGELQRVLLALALEPLPDLLLLDEPAAAMDPSGLELFYSIVSELRRRYDLAIILVTHDLEALTEHADKVVFLNQTVLREGPPAKVLEDEIIRSVFGMRAPAVPAPEPKEQTR